MLRSDSDTMVTPHIECADMTATSLKLPREIKQLADAEAKRQRISSRVFMVDAIKMAVLAAEKRAVVCN